MSELKYFVGNREDMDEKKLERLKQRIKNYIELDNVSVLTGAGASFHLGAPVIRTIPEEMNAALLENTEVKDEYEEHLDSILKEGEDYNSISLEEFLNYLQASRFTLKTERKSTTKTDKLINDSPAKTNVIVQEWVNFQ